MTRWQITKNENYLFQNILQKKTIQIIKFQIFINTVFTETYILEK